MYGEPLKGGWLAQQAAMLCQDAQFQLYLDRRRRAKFGVAENHLPDGTHNAQDAKDFICGACQIHSRAQLDHNPRAAAVFKRIRQRFFAWKQHQESPA